MFSTLFCVLVLCAMGASAMRQGKWFDRIFIIQFENQAYEKVIQDKHFSFYAKAGKNLDNFYAVTHPSQPNYWSQVSGSYYGWNSDSSKNLAETNLVDLMDPHGVTWKAYQEDYHGSCDTVTTRGLYWRKHNPFISFDNVQRNATRCSRIVNAKELDHDLASGQLPQYSYYTPNIENDGHNTGLAYAGNFLHTFMSQRLAKFPKVVITWDEDDNHHGNHIYTALIGSMIAPGTKDSTKYDHFSLLRTVEDNWNLGNLGKSDATAVPFKF